MLWLRGVLRRRCSGRRVVCCWAGLLCVPVGGGPPASRPRRELGSARRLEARPGPATAHGHRSQALHPTDALHTGGARSLMCALRVDSLSGQAPPPPTGTAAWPSGPSGALHTGGAWCAGVGLARCPEARPGSEAVSAISHVIPLRIFQTMNSYRWGFNVSGPC